jgi:superfamily II DNA or RNA helicase
MSDFVIEPIDSAFIRVRCDSGFAKELSDFFTFEVPGHKFMPAYRNRMWDGKIKLYNSLNQQIYAGLYDYVVKFAKDRHYSIDGLQRPDNTDITEEYIQQFCKTLDISARGKRIDPHSHQIEGIVHALRHERCLLLSPTGSGKSLMIYAICRYLQNQIPEDKKILIIVPTISLVTQMYSDFFDYSKGTSWKCREHCHKIFGGQEKDTDKKIVITTWQSVHTLPASYFKQYSAVIGDECHLFKSKSLTSIMTKLTDCPYRIGTTGTLDGSFTHKLVIEGLFGRVHRLTSTKELMEKNLLSELTIDCLVLQYPDYIRQSLKKLTYQEEIDWIVQNQARNEFIANLAKSTKGNTLVLFQFVEKHGKPLYELIKNKVDGRKVFFVFGGTEADDREHIRQIIEKEEDAILIASYGTFSTGVSIRKLHNIVFSSPSKSRIRVLQSIGRQLRKSEFKTKAKLYDIADDLSWKSHENHTLRHFVERLKIYDSEKFEYKKILIPIKEENE